MKSNLVSDPIMGQSSYFTIMAVTAAGSKEAFIRGNMALGKLQSGKGQVHNNKPNQEKVGVCKRRAFKPHSGRRGQRP